MTQTQARTWSVIELLRWTAEYFSKHNVDSPRLSAELLLCEVLLLDRIHLYTDFERLLKPTELKVYRSMIERRALQREPLQYILGNTNFYGCNLLVRPGVLIPRPETEVLVEHAIRYIQEHDVHKVLDIGTGSGCIALAVASNCPNVQLTAIDCSNDALTIAVENMRLNEVTNVFFEAKDIIEDTEFTRPFDVVLSNPPYISRNDYEKLDLELLKHEPQVALTDQGDGLSFYRHFASIFDSIITPGGTFFLEIGYGMGDELLRIFERYEPVIYTDYSGIERVLQGRVS